LTFFILQESFNNLEFGTEHVYSNSNKKIKNCSDISYEYVIKCAATTRSYKLKCYFLYMFYFKVSVNKLLPSSNFSFLKILCRDMFMHSFLLSENKNNIIYIVDN